MQKDRGPSRSYGEFDVERVGGEELIKLRETWMDIAETVEDQFRDEREDPEDPKTWEYR
jgi:hypothetical protein